MLNVHAKNRAIKETARVNDATNTARLPPPPSSSETPPSHEFSFTNHYILPFSPFHLTTTFYYYHSRHCLPHRRRHLPPAATSPYGHLASLYHTDGAISQTPKLHDEVGTRPPGLLSCFFGLENSRKKRQRRQLREAAMDTENGKEKNRGRLVNMSRILKKYYASMMQPLLFVKGEKEKEREEEKVLRRRPFSFSGDHGFKEQRKRGKQRNKTEQLRSAPDSARTSRDNSGALSSSSSSVFSSSDGSTMEELHSAIQAAIAHCKSSLANSKQQGN